jgi:hypothetical protein
MFWETDRTLLLSVGARQDGYMHERPRALEGHGAWIRISPGTARNGCCEVWADQSAAALSGTTTSENAMLPFSSPKQELPVWRRLLDSNRLGCMWHLASQLRQSQGREPSVAWILLCSLLELELELELLLELLRRLLLLAAKQREVVDAAPVCTYMYKYSVGGGEEALAAGDRPRNSLRV